MIYWHYRNGEQEVGPFPWEVLEKLKIAGVIDGNTLVKASDEQDWSAFAEVSNARNAPPTPLSTPLPTPLPTPLSDASYYYLDANRQATGPFDLQTLRRLHKEGVIRASTLTAAKGETQWITVSQLLGVPPEMPSAEIVNAVRHRSFEQFCLMMGVTLTFYSFYILPSYSRDMKAITKRERMEFQPMLILGIVTLGLLLAVMMVAWAYDMEKHGKAMETVGRQESLGTYVLILNVISFLIALFSGGVAIILSAALGVWAIWLLQKEINLYAKSL